MQHRSFRFSGLGDDDNGPVKLVVYGFLASIIPPLGLLASLINFYGQKPRRAKAFLIGAGIGACWQIFVAAGGTHWR